MPRHIHAPISPYKRSCRQVKDVSSNLKDKIEEAKKIHESETELLDTDPENGHPQSTHDESEGQNDQYSEAYVNNDEHGEDTVAAAAAAAATYDDATGFDYTSAGPHYDTSTAGVYDNSNSSGYAGASEDVNTGQFPDQYEYDNTFDHQQYDYDPSQTYY